MQDMAAVRQAFEGPRVRWNLLRTGLCAAALGVLVIGMLADRAPAAARPTSHASSGGRTEGQSDQHARKSCGAYRGPKRGARGELSSRRRMAR